MDSTNDPMQRRVRSRSSVALCAGLMEVVFLVAACSNGPSSPGVAATGGTTTSTTDPGAGSGAGQPTAQNAAKLLDYSHCMQSHGIKDFPDPGPNGTLSITAGQGSDLNPNNPLFAQAQNDCQHLMPQPTAAQKAQAIKNGLKMAQCMRAHGIKDFPDPTSSGAIRIQGGPNSDLNPSDPLFQHAQSACANLLPGGKNGSFRTSDGGPGSGGGNASSGSVIG